MQTKTDLNITNVNKTSTSRDIYVCKWVALQKTSKPKPKPNINISNDAKCTTKTVPNINSVNKSSYFFATATNAIK